MLVAIALAATVQAPLAEHCRRIGQWARVVAQQRDAGVDQAKIVAAMPPGPSPAKSVVARIYADRTITPDTAAGLELSCLLEAPGPEKQRP